MKKTFAIGIPTINRLDLLHPSLLKYVADFPDITIYVLDNGNQYLKKKIEHPNIIVIERDINLGVAGSWNALCKEIFKNHNNALILNDDVYLGRKQGEVEDMLVYSPSNLFVSEQGFCSFIMSEMIFNCIGKFDEAFFPAYFEDNDYLYRMKIAGLNTLYIKSLNPAIYNQSSTIAKNPALKNSIANRDYYIRKWGGEPNSETFTKPFNIQL